MTHITVEDGVTSSNAAARGPSPTSQPRWHLPGIRVKVGQPIPAPWPTERRQRAGHERIAARAQRLTALASEARSAWQRIEAHIATKKTSAYDQAVTLLAELRDACSHTGQETDFRQRLIRLREDNHRRPGLIHRLGRHGLR